MKKNLEPVKDQGADGMKIAQVVADLDHQRFNKRDAAMKQLEAQLLMRNYEGFIRR